ncbi:hypothetical protein H2200_009589 [Cladophialophora chaetospira]|uniref:Uncharacterized protein n=1 Tax=Cladophialophora chaetospira TaxID=386627 RepID=A0AA38X2Y5_9EURO|nr:hypothetical protein H2200_009589 [Cladophialophora chaetospira]
MSPLTPKTPVKQAMNPSGKGRITTPRTPSSNADREPNEVLASSNNQATLISGPPPAGGSGKQPDKRVGHSWWDEEHATRQEILRLAGADNLARGPMGTSRSSYRGKAAEETLLTILDLLSSEEELDQSLPVQALQAAREILRPQTPGQVFDAKDKTIVLLLLAMREQDTELREYEVEIEAKEKESREQTAEIGELSAEAERLEELLQQATRRLRASGAQ